MSFLHDTDMQKPSQAPRPRTALLFYGNEQSTFVMEHSVYDAGGRTRVGAGRALDPDEFRRRLTDMGERMIPNAPPVVVDRSIVATDERLTSWVRPAGVTTMFLRHRDERGLETLTVPWPRLLFTVTRQRALLVAALPDEGPVTGDTPLYHAPFGNVYDTTAMCRGSVVYPDGVVTHDLAAWEAAFTDSTFVHTNHGLTMNPEALNARGLRVPDDDENDPPVRMRAPVDGAEHFALWRSLEGEASFPEDVLNPLDVTVQAYLAQIARQA